MYQATVNPTSARGGTEPNPLSVIAPPLSPGNRKKIARWAISRYKFTASELLRLFQPVCKSAGSERARETWAYRVRVPRPPFGNVPARVSGPSTKRALRRTILRGLIRASIFSGGGEERRMEIVQVTNNPR
ncbi:hypothetical protein K0M31_004340 [Melipona bicolor]|uniref:Uncharacterized protein n=1 Tax=Melipona bicolor TaxID=60889 RepID=A0AA40FXJ6_9HYME|nr:hypothetical protein K0M31_004340 [Melipona bicolor]